MRRRLGACSMKTSPLLALFAACLALAGCGTPPKGTATLARYVGAKPETTRRIIAEEAEKAGFKPIAADTWQRTLTKRKDPVLGLVTLSDGPSLALRFTVTIAHNGRGCLIEALPELAFYHLSDGSLKQTVQTRGMGVDEINRLLDRIVAKCGFAAHEMPAQNAGEQNGAGMK